MGLLLRSVCRTLAKPKLRRKKMEICQVSGKWRLVIAKDGAVRVTKNSNRQPSSDCCETIEEWQERTAMCVSAKAYIRHVARLEKARELAKNQRRRDRDKRRLSQIMRQKNISLVKAKI